MFVSVRVGLEFKPRKAIGKAMDNVNNMRSKGDLTFVKAELAFAITIKLMSSGATTIRSGT